MLLSIQYIRALASIMVVIVHTYGGFGAQGVDIFFIISGFIMMHIMYFNHKGALYFFFQRLFRVAPIYYLFTIISLSIGNVNEPTIEHIIHSLLFLKLKWSSPVLSIGWTLEYEFMFYCLCSLALAFPISKKHRSYLIAGMLIILSIILDFILFPEKAYGHFLEFFMGMMCYFLVTYISNGKYKFLSKKYLVSLAILSLILLFVVQVFIYSDGKLPFRFLGYGLLSLVFCTSFILMEPYLFKSKVLLLLGNASYAIYISHTTTLFLYYKIFSVDRYYSFLSDTFSIIFVIVVGVLSHFYIELPISRHLSAKNISVKLLSSFPINKMPNNFLNRKI